MKIEVNFRFIVIGLLICFLYKFDIYVIFLLSILLHEIAHMIIGRILGLKVKMIKINPLGVSLEYMSFKEKNKILKKIILALAGPVFNFIIAILFYYLNIDYSLKINLVYTNIALGIFNLIPILPLDGGKILKELIIINLGYKRANIVSLNISKCILVCISLLYSILIFKIQNIFIFCVIVYLWYLHFIEERKLKTLVKVYNILERV